GVLGYARQDLAQVRLRVKPVELGRLHQTVDRRGPLAARIRTHEEVVAAAKRDPSQRAFRRVVVDLDAAVVPGTRQRPPARERVADHLGQFRLRRHLADHAGEPGTHVVEQRPGAGLSLAAPYVGWLTPD